MSIRTFSSGTVTLLKLKKTKYKYDLHRWAKVWQNFLIKQLCCFIWTFKDCRRTSPANRPRCGRINWCILTLKVILIKSGNNRYLCAFKVLNEHFKLNYSLVPASGRSQSNFEGVFIFLKEFKTSIKWQILFYDEGICPIKHWKGAIKDITALSNIESWGEKGKKM